MATDYTVTQTVGGSFQILAGMEDRSGREGAGADMQSDGHRKRNKTEIREQ